MLLASREIAIFIPNLKVMLAMMDRTQLSPGKNIEFL